MTMTQSMTNGRRGASRKQRPCPVGSTRVLQRNIALACGHVTRESHCISRRNYLSPFFRCRCSNSRRAREGTSARTTGRPALRAAILTARPCTASGRDQGGDCGAHCERRALGRPQALVGSFGRGADKGSRAMSSAWLVCLWRGLLRQPLFALRAAWTGCCAGTARNWLGRSGWDGRGAWAVLAGLLYLRACWFAFVWDDRAAVIGNSDVVGSTSWGELWQHDFWGLPIQSKCAALHACIARACALQHVVRSQH